MQATYFDFASTKISFFRSHWPNGLTCFFSLFFGVSNTLYSLLINTMFGWVDFREDGKVWRENRRKNEKGCCLVRREGEENFWWGPGIFHPAHLKLVSPKWRENSVEGVLWLNDKIAHCTNFVPLSFFFSFCLLSGAFAPFKALFIIIIIIFTFWEQCLLFFFF